MRARRRNLVRLLVGTAASAAFLWLFLRRAEPETAWEQARALPLATVAAAVALVAVNVVVMGLRWRYLLAAAGHEPPLRSLVSSVAVGRAANNVIPARGGDLLRIESMREVASVPALVTAGTLFAERLLDGVVLSLFILLGALLMGAGAVPLLTGIALSSGTALGVFLVVLAARRPEGAARLAERATRRLPERWRGRAAQEARHFVVGLGAFRRRRPLVLAGLASLGMWIADVVMFALVGRAYGLDLGLGGYLLIEGIGNLALAVPATAAGLGTFDYITFLAARHVELDERTATAYVLTMHAFVVLPVTVFGALLLRPALPRLFRGPASERE